MYRTEADNNNEKLPTGIPHIIGNEAAERFSFYGMKAILAVFLTKYLMDGNGNPDLMSEKEATAWVHFFNTGVYLTPIVGAIVADRFFGKYKTIIFLSIVYCCGHFALALDETRNGVFLGLMLIAIGAGGIKPCVSAHVGDQFGEKNSHMLPKIFGWFYFSINLGAFTSMLLTPYALENWGPAWAFGIPGGLMVIATIVFWMGRKLFVHIPAAGKDFTKDTFSPEGMKITMKLILIYLFVAMFWALFDQTSSKWVFQAQKMNMEVFGMKILPSQMQSLNPILVLTFIPIFSYVLYPFLGRFFEVTPLRKIAIGFFISIGAFALPMWIESRIQVGEAPSILWQALAYVLITAAEIMISITCLEFSYTQAPKSMKSFIMGLFMASVALGNLFTALVNMFGPADLTGVAYYKFFTICIAVTAVLFLFVVKFYKTNEDLEKLKSAE
jgi:POT family proton-dependent oligopeptide transporter